MLYEEAKPKKNPPRNPAVAPPFLRANAPTCNNKTESKQKKSEHLGNKDNQKLAI
jgi:hypothetical protein